jgi:hypothetical protein
LDLYDLAKTEVSKGALVELALALQAYRSDIVLAGGWAPYFLTLGHFRHCGSLDIDLVLRPKVMIRYEKIRQIVVEALGYKTTDREFKFEKQLKDRKGTLFRVELDFLSEPEAVQKAGLVKIQEGLEAVLIPGCSTAFDFNYEQEVKGTIPDDGDATEIIQVADIVGSLTMKGLALGRATKLEKDSYDIYAVAGFHEGSPVQAAAKFSQTISDKSSGQMPDVTATALGRIYKAFETQSSYGSQAVSRFMMSDASLDARERVNAFREACTIA